MEANNICPSSSPLSSLVSSCSPPPSSPLSVLSNSPSLPSSPLNDASNRYPSPSTTTVQSGSASPMKPSDLGDPPDAICVRMDGPPPAKRRRIREPKKPKVRTTEYLDLERTDDSGPQDELLTRLLAALRKKKRIVIIAGAGISVSAGIPDFRSSTGLFTTLRGQHGVKASGKHLFDASVYKHNSSTSSFHSMVRELAGLTERAKPTSFHHMLASLAQEGRLMRLYTQNVDCLETSMEPLATKVPLNAKGPWPRTIQLHGSLAHMVCSKCGDLESFDSSRFEGPEAPLCNRCIDLDEVRTSFAGKRSHGVGRLRPRIVLYNEYNPDEEAIGMVSKADLRRVPDAVIVVGTSLKIPGVRRLVKEMCQVTRSRRDGFTAWLNVDPEPQGAEFKDCWDLVVRGKCDDVAELVNLPRWDQSDLDVGNSWEVTRESVESKVKRHLKNPVVNITPSGTPSGMQSGDDEDVAVEADGGKSKLAEQVRRVKRTTEGGIPTPSASPKLQSMLPTKAHASVPSTKKQITLSFTTTKSLQQTKKSKKGEAAPDGNKKLAKSGKTTAPATTKGTTTKRKTAGSAKDTKSSTQDLTLAFKATKSRVAPSTPLKEKFSSPLSSPVDLSDSSALNLPSLRPGLRRSPLPTPLKQNFRSGTRVDMDGSSSPLLTLPRTPSPPPSSCRRTSSCEETISPTSKPQSMRHLID